MTSTRSLLILSVTLLMLSACSDMRESLGLGRSPPDEFAVVDRPPLSMPPDFGLRPPRPGAPRPQETDTSKTASTALFGTTNTKPAPVPVDTSGAEKALIETTGANKVDPNIRETVDREASDKVVGSEHLVDELMWWKRDPQEGTTVNATAEAARLRDAKEKGEPLNQGATPVIEKQSSGWLGL